ncbi:glycoside hydrolase domain-containing protein [Kribbella sp. NPDC051587]|uniref:glycoside hydrolase domain-containing protein n=1 Tax=Kribbella sp. NPDC051587 TaxID=3364119 RepID=UPI0037941B6A
MGSNRFLSAVLSACVAGTALVALPAKAQPTAVAGFTVATADSMDLSYPKPDAACACEPGVRVLDVTRGEREDTQVVALASTAVTGLRAAITGVRGPDGAPADPAALSATVAPLGFLNVTPSSAYKGVHTYKGWIPDPIRTDLTAVNVAAGERQPFWLEVSSGKDAVPGIYRVTVALTDAAGATVEQQVDTRVWPVAISEHNELGTMLTTRPDSVAELVYGITDHQAMRDFTHKTYDFLTSYRIEPDNIYAGKPAYSSMVKPGPDPDDLKYLQSKGWLNRFSAYNLRPDLPSKVDLTKPATWTAAVEARMVELRSNMAAYAAAGVADKAYVYGFDELNTLEGKKFAKQMFSEVKAEFPALPIVTSIFDATMGTAEPKLTEVDVWAPELFRYPANGAATAHAKSKKLYWYPAIASGAPAPNWFNGYPPIDSRMLMGVMSHAEGVDGVLYYNLNRWYATDAPHKPMTDGIYSSWNPATLRETAGDGSVYYPGKDGPLGSQRLANMRDGLEDYNLLQELKRRAAKPDVDPELKLKADRLLKPNYLVQGVNTHSEASEALRQHRLDVLELITKFDGTTAPAGPVLKLLPIGSSTIDGNTAEPNGTGKANGGARPELWQWFRETGQQVDFVGPTYDADQVIGDRDHGGVDGDLALVRSKIDSWMATYQPDAVLMHSGSREVLSETYNLANLSADYNAVLDRIWAANPNAQVYLGTVGPITQDGQDDITRTNTANATILEIFRTRLESGKNVRLLDNRSRINDAKDRNTDHIHLNVSGYSRAAAGWFGGISDTRPKRLEAEAGTFGGLATALTTYYASNQGKAGKIDDASSYVELAYNAPYAGTYQLMVSGATGTQQPAAHNISVNGGPPQTVTYAPYAWDKWVLRGLTVQLKAGKNTIRVTKAGGFAELDFIDVVPPSGDRHAAGPTYLSRDALDRVATIRNVAGVLTDSREGAPGAAWITSTIPVTGVVGTPSVVLDASGRVNYFARTTAGKVLHGWEQTIGHLDWQSELLDVSITGDPVATLDVQNQLVYVARSGTGLIYGRGSTASVIDGMTPDGEPTVALDKDGALRIAVRTPAGALQLAFQTAPGSPVFTNRLAETSGVAGRPAIAVDSIGSLRYLFRRTDGKLQFGTTALDTVAVAGDPTFEQDNGGKLTYAVRTTDNKILHGWQDAPNAAWQSTVLPTVAGAPIQGDPQLVLDYTRRLAYVAQSGDRLVYGRQSTPGLGPWVTTVVG